MLEPQKKREMIDFNQLDIRKQTSELCFNIEAGSPFDVYISGICLDSRKITSGDLFVALAGDSFVGHDYIDSAIKLGAAAIFCEPHQSWQDSYLIGDVPVLVIPKLKSKLGVITSRFFSNPSSSLDIIGITGTNGKTSTAWLAAQLLEALEYDTAIVGTLGTGRPNSLVYSGFTTPDWVSLQSTLHDFVKDDVSHVAMEVSSHGIALERVKGTEFNTLVFTNLTHDHLDFHGSIKEYAEAKKALFQCPSANACIVNVDDTVGLEIARETLAKEIYLISEGDATGLKAELAGSGKQVSLWHIESICCLVDSIEALLNIEGNLYTVILPLIGRFNALNAIYAMASVYAQTQCELNSIFSASRKLQLPAGRMFKVSPAKTLQVGCGQAVVDYAHTPDALENALHALRAHSPSRIICVFGCGGDRDKVKRPKMGEIATRLSDITIITNDNPRYENPQNIIDDVLSGIEQPNSLRVIEDREEAIIEAMRISESGDLILIAGKGHEDYQDTMGEKRYFDDAEVVKNYLDTLNSADRNGRDTH